jgi:uncharacterized protein YlaN (UPF0358 family)
MEEVLGNAMKRLKKELSWQKRLANINDACDKVLADLEKRTRGLTVPAF